MKDEFIIETPYLGDVKRKTSGVYMIMNSLDGKCYIGSSVDVHRRMKEHKQGKGNGHLARAIKKHGKDKFSFFLIETCERKFLLQREGFWMQHLPTNYNLIALKENGRKEYTEEHKHRITKHFKGKKLSRAHKEKIRQSLIGVPLTEERKEKIRAKAIGRKASMKTRRKLSRIRKGKVVWNKGKRMSKRGNKS